MLAAEALMENIRHPIGVNKTSQSVFLKTFGAKVRTTLNTKACLVQGLFFFNACALKTFWNHLSLVFLSDETHMWTDMLK